MLWSIFLLVFVISHLGCMLFGLTRLLTTDQRFVTTYLIIGPLLSFTVGAQTFNFIYFFNETVSPGLLALPFTVYGAFLGIYLAFQISTIFNKLIHVRIVSKESFLKTYIRTLLIVTAAFNAVGILMFATLSWQMIGFSEKLKSQTVSLTQGSKYCILDLSNKPVLSTDNINYWKVSTEAIAYKLGLLNSVQLTSDTVGTFIWRGVHFALVLPNRYYYWSFREQKFIEGEGSRRSIQICSDAGAWRN